MSIDTSQQEPAEILEELGLQTYEAQCFVALTRMPHATAKELSEVSEVPRTRVYDAIDQLQAYGLVDVQHSNPKQFRSVSVSEAIELLRQRFDQRFERLGNTLDQLEPVGQEATPPEGNVWSTTGTDAITSRMIQFLDAATDEIVLVVGGSKVLSEELFNRLSAAAERDVKLYVGTLAASNHEEIHAAVPEAQVFESELNWLQPDEGNSDEHRIGRLLLVDREMLLLSSIGPDDSTDTETAIWSDNVGNGLIVIARRLLATGLDSRYDEGGAETPPENG